LTRSVRGPGGERTVSRRELLVGGAATLGAAALSPWVGLAGGCRAPRQEPGEALPAGDGAATAAVRREFPLLDVSGEPYAIGVAVGKRFGTEIRAVFERRRGWFDGLARFAANDGRATFAAIVEAARKHVPEVVEEVRGMADGARVPLDDLLVLNARCELEAAQLTPAGCPGCSTIVVATGEKLLVAHNEDGDVAWRDLMFLVRVLPPSGVRFLALCYAGLVPGNAPAINDRGVAFVTNYIGTTAWRPGIPRYFLDRKALEARNPDEAVERVLHAERGYGFHHVFAAMSHGRPRAVAVEATPSRAQVREISGVYVHTNHLVLDELAGEAQVESYVRRSSQPRYATLTEALGRVAEPTALPLDELVRLLSSHEGAPYSPCRHPADTVRGLTVACAAFDVPRRRMRLYAGNPCEAGSAEYVAPEAEALA
jgi:predicted choloylglycine hydrolase